MRSACASGICAFGCVSPLSRNSLFDFETGKHCTPKSPALVQKACWRQLPRPVFRTYPLRPTLISKVARLISGSSTWQFALDKPRQIDIHLLYVLSH